MRREGWEGKVGEDDGEGSVDGMRNSMFKMRICTCNRDYIISLQNFYHEIKKEELYIRCDVWGVGVVCETT